MWYVVLGVSLPLKWGWTNPMWPSSNWLWERILFLLSGDDRISATHGPEPSQGPLFSLVGVSKPLPPVVPGFPGPIRLRTLPRLRLGPGSVKPAPRSGAFHSVLIDKLLCRCLNVTMGVIDLVRPGSNVDRAHLVRGIPSRPLYLRPPSNFAKDLESTI